ncbi:MAG: ABC transporter ATP-binding protein [Christensenellaceae bacterium]|jgi:NitT/TauT family transport system ATP-binding protein|nr:ABC transporter ATP-binding protein [Christensenellaceae bacterium]
MIEFENVSFLYDNEIIIKNFSQIFDKNKIHCILGPSGCGKTTLLNLIADLIKPTLGIIHGITDGVSYAFQDECIIPQVTCLSNLNFALTSAYPKRSARIAICHEFLNAVGLSNEYKKYPHEMSGGMRQRLTLARCFAYPSNILLMDEPFKALDIMLKLEILDLFISLWQKDQRTVVFITHDPDEAARCADIAYVCNGVPFNITDEINISSPRSQDNSKYSKLIYEALVRHKTMS